MECKERAAGSQLFQDLKTTQNQQRNFHEANQVWEEQERPRKVDLHPFRGHVGHVFVLL